MCLTSEGNDRLTADGTNARWCMVGGESADGKGTNGVLFLSYPENRCTLNQCVFGPLMEIRVGGICFFNFVPFDMRMEN